MSLLNRSTNPRAMRRRAVGRILQKAQHALPGIVLLQDGVKALRAGAEGWHFVLGVTEILTAAAVTVAFVFALRALRAQLKNGGVPHPHAGIDWVDVFISAVLFTEVWAHWVESGHVQGPNVLLGAVMLVLGLWGYRFVPWKNSQFRRVIGKSEN